MNQFETKFAFDVVDLSLKPRKPGLPLVLQCALILWASSAATFYLTDNVDGAWCRGAISIALGCAIAALVCGVVTNHLYAGILVSFALLGLAVGGAATYSVISGYEAAVNAEKVAELNVIQDSSTSDFGYTTLCQARTETGNFVLVRAFTKESYLSGQSLRCSDALQPLNESGKAMYRTQGIAAQVRTNSAEIIAGNHVFDSLLAIRAKTIQCIKDNAGDAAPLYNALLCGYRQDIANTSVYEDFKTCGLAHMVAVSGAHTSIVLMLLMVFLNALRVPKKITVVLSVCFVGAYVVFAGMPISALRSALMSVLALCSFFVKRRGASIASIGICIISFLIIAPTTALSVALFLSAGSTLGIILFSHLFNSWLPRLPDKMHALFVEPLSLTTASNIATLPFSAALFSQVSLIAPIANLITAPLFGIVCVGGLLGCVVGYVFPFLAGTVLPISALPMHALSWIVSTIASLPYASVPCELSPPLMIALSCACMVTLWVAWPSGSKSVAKGIAVVAMLVVLGYGASLVMPHGNTITALDVGQGDALLIRSGRATVLVDTGNNPTLLRKELGRFGVVSLDAVVITHPDDDHCASLETLGSYVNVKKIYVAQGVLNCACSKCKRLLQLAHTSTPHAEIEGLEVKDCLTIGMFQAHIVWPGVFKDEGGNADSVCMLVELDSNKDGANDWRALLTGDAESEQLNELVKQNVVGDIDVLKVGHHGSKISLTQDLLNVLKPEVALLSCGAHNRYGHPSKEVLSLLNEARSCSYRTDEQGSITITFTEGSMKTSTVK